MAFYRIVHTFIIRIVYLKYYWYIWSYDLPIRQMRQQKGDHMGAIKVLDKALSSGKEELVSDHRVPF